MAAKHKRLVALVSFFILAIAGAVFAVHWINQRYAATVAVTPTPTPPAQNLPPPQASPLTPPPSSTVPKSKLLSVPFTPQAPTANWDELHNEACEEASAIMAHAYFSGITQQDKLDPNFVETELAKITDWEKQTFGYYLDINSTETARLLEEIYGLTAEVRTSFTENTIKEELAKGNLILFPAAGRLLGNPNFRAPGPPYHMVVIKGYTQANFITNDPGTRNGQSYPYSYEVLYNANGEWDHQEHAVNINNKSIIIVSK